MKQQKVLLMIIGLVLLWIFITACKGVIGGGFFDGPSGEWVINANINLGDGDWEGISEGETNVQISEDLETITGNATMVIPPVSPRNIKQMSRIVLNSGAVLLVRELLPGLNQPIKAAQNGNTIYADEGEGLATIEFNISFNEQNEVQGILTVGFLGDEQYLATITRSRNNEKPNEVKFRVDVPGLEAQYEVTATR